MTVSNQTPNFLSNRRPIDDCDQLNSMFDSSANKKKLEEEIAYAKKLETFVHKTILPEIDKTYYLRFKTLDDIAHQDFHGLRERIFTCTAAVDRIIERHNKNTDHVDLLLDLIICENQTFTDVIYNGTRRANFVEKDQPHLNLNNWTKVSKCKDHTVATTFIDIRDSMPD